jgi:hypothetical protein
MAPSKSPSPTPKPLKSRLRKSVTRKNNSGDASSTKATPRKQAPASSRKNRAAPSKKNAPRLTASAAKSPFPFTTQKAYIEEFKSRFDRKQVKRDEDEDRKARKVAQKQVETRDCGTECNQQTETIVDDQTLVHVLRLDRSKEDHDTYLSGIEPRYVTELKTFYPPLYEWASESMAATTHWRSVWHYTPLKDVRHKTIDRYPIKQLDLSKMNVVRVDQSFIFYDSKKPNKPVLVVLRDFVEDKEIRKAIGMMSITATIERRSDRRDDPGVMAALGKTAGSRKAKEMGMAKNLHSKKRRADTGQCTQDDYRNGGLLAALWNIMRKSLPEVIIADYDDTIAELDLGRLDTGLGGQYELELDSGKYRFTTGDLAPPTALAGWNYARYAHLDYNANEYMISYTSDCNVEPRSGGNFYLSKYGMYVEQAANTCVSWMPEDPHGTTLPESVEGRQNFGVSVAVSNTLDGVRAKAQQREEAAMEGAEMEEE